MCPTERLMTSLPDLWYVVDRVVRPSPRPKIMNESNTAFARVDSSLKPIGQVCWF